MCPPPDSAARDGAPAGLPTSRGRVPPPPDVGPRPDSVVARAPPAPAVAPPDPATLVATPDRTVVTRRPRASHRPSEPHELMPTLRMPPVEARALRRQASGAPEAEAEPMALGSGEIEIDASEPPAPTFDPPPTPAAVASTPVEDARDRQATVRVASIPQEGTTIGTPPRPPARLHRPPLPLPDVLRNGPRPAPRSERVAEPLVEVAAFAPAVPDSIPIIDTASLVLEMAESLAAVPAPEPTPDAPRDDEAQVDADQSDGAVLAVQVSAAPRSEPTESRVAPIEIEDDVSAIAPRRRGVLAIAIGVAASITAAVWWLAPPSRDAAHIDAAFAPLGEQLAFVAENTPQPEPIAQVVAPDAAPTPALVAPPSVTPATELLGVAAGDLIADAMLSPTQPAVPTVDDAVIEVHAAAVAAPAPAAAPKAKPSVHKPKPKPKPKPKASPNRPPEPKTAAAAPPPAPKSTTSLDPAALLREAEKAYAEGRYATALRSAQRSLAGRNDARATRIVALSACKLKRESVAKSAFDRLPLGQRRGVRNTCKDAGIKL